MRKREKGHSVLLVANYASDVGYAWWLMENFWTVIANELSSQGRQCVLAYPVINDVPEQIREARIILEQVNLRPHGIANVLAGIRVIRKHHIRSIYLTDWPAFSFLYLLWRLIGVHSIVGHDHTPGDRPKARGIRAFLKSAAHGLRVFSCHTYVGVSDYIRQRLVDNSRVPPDRALVVRNGIRAFSCDAVPRLAVRASIGVRPAATMVALVSRATYYKGWDFAVRCLAELRRRSPRHDIQLVFCGDGPDLQAFRALSETLGVADHSLFLGKRDDVRAILCSADLAFHPSRGEAMSLATLEFLCAGLPVVVPDRPSVCGIIDDRVTGIIYRAEDVGQGAAAIELLVDDEGLRTELGRNARDRVLARHLLEDTNLQFKAVVVPRL